MAELWNMAILFLLAFIGLVTVSLLIFFLWLAYRYDISVTVHSRDKKTSPAPDSKEKGQSDEPGT